MPRSLTFLVPGDPNEGSRNQRLHWQAERRLKERWNEKTRWALQEMAEPWFAQRVRITFTLYRGRALDPDNAAGSLCLKSLTDQLKGRFFPDDSAKHVCYGPIQQVTGKQYRTQPAVAVLIEEIE